MIRNFSRRTFVQHAAVMGGSCLVLTPSFAQGVRLPAIVKIVVPLPAGGGVDVAVRILGEQLAKAVGSSVVIENKLGAAGAIAAQSVAASGADGSVLLYAHSGMLTVQAMTGNLNLLRDLKPITKISATAHLLSVPTNSPFKTQAELITAIQAKPGKYNYGSGGNGSPTHLMVERLAERVPGGMNAMHIPFKGGTESSVALISGDIDFAFLIPSVAAEHAKGGKLRVLATSGVSRLGLMPQVPTVAEAGVPGFRDEPWGAVMVSSKVPDAVVARLYEAITASAQSAAFSAYVLKTGGTLEHSASPAAFADEIRQALESEKVLVQRLGLKPT